MKKSILLLLVFLPLFAFTAAHKFYVSATDIEYNEDQRTLQIISHVFADDIEKLLQTRYSDELTLVKNDEHPAADEYLEKYFREKFRVSVNEKTRKFNYIGKEYDKDELLVYLEIEDVEPLKTIRVENAVLMDLFPEQKNVIKVEYNSKIKSLLLIRDDQSGTLKFSN